MLFSEHQVASAPCAGSGCAGRPFLSGLNSRTSANDPALADTRRLRFCSPVPNLKTMPPPISVGTRRREMCRRGWSQGASVADAEPSETGAWRGSRQWRATQTGCGQTRGGLQDMRMACNERLSTLAQVAVKAAWRRRAETRGKERAFADFRYKTRPT